MKTLDFLIVALGNPGPKYLETRHNAGWIVLDQFTRDLDWNESKYAQAAYAKDALGKTEVEYIKPLTMMNNSGVSVRYAKDKHHILNENIIVLYDDIDLPLGKIKISHNRGSGGHNGIRSIEQHIGGADFTRIRIGISRELEGGKVHKPPVLGKFNDEEMKKLNLVSKKAKEAIRLLVVEGREAAMNAINAG